MANLSMRGIVKDYGSVRIVHGVDLDVKDGEFVVFVGPSGCGKSTLLRMIAGLEPISAGDLFLDGARVNDVSAADRGLAMVFQSYALYPHMSVYQNMAFGLENIKMKRADIEARVNKSAEMLQITKLLQRTPRQLSGGQRQRVAIGRAITREPRMFLFDEPLSNLDAELRVEMRAELTGLHRRLKSTMIYVTHDQVEAMTMADRIVVLRAGRVEQVGAPLELYNRPNNRFVAGFLGAPRMNFVEAKVAQIMPQGVRIEAPGLGTLDVATDGLAAADEPVALGIRPEHVALAAASPIRVKVETVEQLGGSTVVHGVLSQGTRMIFQSAEQAQIRSGDDVGVEFKAEGLRLFRAGPDGAAIQAATKIPSAQPTKVSA